MALKPSSDPANLAKTPRFNPTVLAIAASVVIAFILATLLTGNPFRAMRLAYTDYSATPASGVAKVDPAPANQPNTPTTAPAPVETPAVPSK